MFIKKTISYKVKKLLNALLEKRVMNDIPERSIENIQKVITNNIIIESENNLKQFDKKITQTFSIPKNICLPEDYIQKLKYTSEDENNLQEAYNELKNRYTHVSFSNLQRKKNLNAFSFA